MGAQWEGLQLLILGTQREERRGVGRAVGHAGEISQQTKERVEDPEAHEKNTRGTQDVGT